MYLLCIHIHWIQSYCGSDTWKVNHQVECYTISPAKKLLYFLLKGKGIGITMSICPIVWPSFSICLSVLHIFVSCLVCNFWKKTYQSFSHELGCILIDVVLSPWSEVIDQDQVTLLSKSYCYKEDHHWPKI